MGLKNQYGTETKLLAQLELTHTDGSVQTVATDAGWDWSNDGPIRFADNKDGEVVYANNVPPIRERQRSQTILLRRLHPTTSRSRSMSG